MIRSNYMATEHILALLIQERDKLNRAIESLQGARRRGRPPKAPTAAVNAVAAGPGKRLPAHAGSTESTGAADEGILG